MQMCVQKIYGRDRKRGRIVGDGWIVMYVADGLGSPECVLADSPAFVPVQEIVAALQSRIRRRHQMHSLGDVVRPVCRWYFFEPLMHRLHVASKAGRG